MPDYSTFNTENPLDPENGYPKFDDLNQKIIVNDFRPAPDGGAYEVANVLNALDHSEGHDLDRVRFTGQGEFRPQDTEGHVISFTGGKGVLEITNPTTHETESYEVGSEHIGGEGLEGEVHCYIPKGFSARIISSADKPLTFEKMSSNQVAGSDAPGTEFLIRDERVMQNNHGEIEFEGDRQQVTRWVVTPQYTSRRAFLDHDATLTAKLKPGQTTPDPVSMWHTSMNDTTQLADSALNADNIKVFRMSYNNGTEFNIVQKVTGPEPEDGRPKAEVRYAIHPYMDENDPVAMREQQWSPWMPLDEAPTYYLNEPAGAEERVTERPAGEEEQQKELRNRHEVRISEGCRVYLHCSFNPAPTGSEMHAVGKYSGYAKAADTKALPRYGAYIAEMRRLDEVLDRESKISLRREGIASQAYELTDAILNAKGAPQTHARVTSGTGIKKAVGAMEKRQGVGIAGGYLPSETAVNNLNKLYPNGYDLRAPGHGQSLGKFLGVEQGRYLFEANAPSSATNPIVHVVETNRVPDPKPGRAQLMQTVPGQVQDPNRARGVRR
jgi:hypothetical protein